MMLPEIALFVRAVELGSLTAAARSLRTSTTSASVRIGQLEKHVGARLLIRTTRSLQVTEAGRAFYEHALDILGAIQRAEDSVANLSGAATGVLKVAAPLAFSRRVLAPLVAEFHREQPGVQVRLRSTDTGADLLAEHIDIAVRTSPLPDSSFLVRKLADGPRVICASSSYLAARGRPEHPDELSHHNCLLLRYPGSTDFRWTFDGPAGRTSVAVSGGFDSDDGEVLTEWALRGEGIVLKHYWEVGRHIQAGRLEVLLPNYCPPAFDVVLVYPNRELLAAKTRLFADFLVTRVRGQLADLR